MNENNQGLMVYRWSRDHAEIPATSEETELHDRVWRFAEFFEDMLFEYDTPTYEFIKCESLSSADGEWSEDEVIRPPELQYFSYDYFRYCVESKGRAAGSFNPKTYTLTVSPDYLDDDDVILHEMIHLHEFVINQLPMFYHDMLYWALYQDLREQIPKLDEIITGHAHLLTGTDLYHHGGTHDILFLLKSFDLDIRMNYPLGTVFSYGRDQELKDYTYIKMQAEE